MLAPLKSISGGIFTPVHYFTFGLWFLLHNLALFLLPETCTKYGTKYGCIPRDRDQPLGEPELAQAMTAELAQAISFAPGVVRAMSSSD